MIRNRMLGFGLTLASLGLIILYGFLESWHSAYVARTFRSAYLRLVLRLLLLLPGFLLTWAVRGVSFRRWEFSLADFLTYALLPLCLLLCPLLLIGLGRINVRVPDLLLYVWEYLSGLQAMWALVAGWGLGFSFHR